MKARVSTLLFVFLGTLGVVVAAVFAGQIGGLIAPQSIGMHIAIFVPVFLAVAALTTLMAARVLGAGARRDRDRLPQRAALSAIVLNAGLLLACFWAIFVGIVTVTEAFTVYLVAEAVGLALSKPFIFGKSYNQEP